MVARFKENTFTPQARGSTQWVCHLQRRKRIYPACAGINLCRSSAMVLFSNLPRVRGDQPIEYASLTEETFTPHARGSTRLCRRRKRPPKILPACAGINPGERQVHRKHQHLPRMRGDQPNLESKRDCQEKFTPHARGSTRIWDRSC